MADNQKISRRKFLLAAGVALPAAALACREEINLPFISSPSGTKPTAAPNTEIKEGAETTNAEGHGAAPLVEEEVKTGEQAFQRLLEGNQRFANGQPRYPNQSTKRRAELVAGQKPFATILSCVDSRVPPEIVFDRGMGDIFVIRTAGQVLDSAALGSIQFGAEELKIPLIVVLGHEKCGAVKATIETIEANATAPDKIQYLVEQIKPSVEIAKNQPGDLLTNAIVTNVSMGVYNLKNNALLGELLHAGKIRIVGARYNLSSGTVDVLSVD